MKDERCITLKNDIREIRRLAKMLRDWGEERGWPEEVIADLHLAGEEVVANIIHYGYDDDDEHEIAVRCVLKPGEVVLRVKDSGRAFNPLDAPPPRIDIPLEERQVGGLGIHLVRNVIDELDYRREDGKNILTMRKRVRVQ